MFDGRGTHITTARATIGLINRFRFFQRRAPRLKSVIAAPLKK